MSICNPCTKLKPVSFCGSEVSYITIGTKAGANLGNSLYLYFKNLATGAIYAMVITNTYNAAGGGLNTFTITYADQLPLATETGYEIWISDTSSGSPTDKITFSVGTTPGDCFIFSGTPIIYNISDEVNEIYDNQTLSIAG